MLADGLKVGDELDVTTTSYGGVHGTATIVIDHVRGSGQYDDYHPPRIDGCQQQS